MQFHFHIHHLNYSYSDSIFAILNDTLNSPLIESLVSPLDYYPPNSVFII